MDYLFQGASSSVTDKSFFHKINMLSPYVKIINIQTKLQDCGSDSSNWKGKETAKIANKTFDSDYGYPFPDTKCYATQSSQQFSTEPWKQKDNTTTLSYAEGDRMVSSGKGLIYDYDGSGYSKIVKVDFTDQNFF